MTTPATHADPPRAGSTALALSHDTECGDAVSDVWVRRLLDAYEFRQRAYTRWAVGSAVVLAVSIQVLGVASAGPGFTLGAGGPPWANVVLVVVAGALAGSIIAELHHLRRRTDTVRTAGLDVRSYSDYARPRLRAGMWAAVAAVMALTAVSVAATRSIVGLLFTAAAVATAAVVEVVARRVARRPRPALRAPMRHADDVIRRSAVNRSLLARGLALNLLVLANATLWLADTATLERHAAAAGTAALIAFVAALVVVHRSRRWILTSPPRTGHRAT